ncbi:AAA family ATPase [Moraxella bovoculi]|uniref:AAA family ATPase n=1 Tax=Moraxella bovoculi TaxID=386891 RepID=UPI003F506425
MEYLCGSNSSRYEYVQFHPSFTYKDFIDGIKPNGIDDKGGVKLELVNGIFKKFFIRAKKDPDNNYYFIVDEINRANLSAVFDETLSLLES